MPSSVDVHSPLPCESLLWVVTWNPVPDPLLGLSWSFVALDFKGKGCFSCLSYIGLENGVGGMVAVGVNSLRTNLVFRADAKTAVAPNL